MMQGVPECGVQNWGGVEKTDFIKLICSLYTVCVNKLKVAFTKMLLFKIHYNYVLTMSINQC